VSADRIVIVGAGQGASVATRTLRRRGYDGSIVLLGDEVEAPYQRPPLSKEYLTDRDESSLWLLPPAWTEANGVDVRTGVTVTRVDTSAGAVELADGSSLTADAVLLATGGRPRTLPAPPSPRIHHLRTKADADRLRDDIRPGARVVIVGAGFIGAEVASSALQLGASVTVLEAEAAPLQRVLGDRLGGVCGEIQRRAGVDLRLGTSVTDVRVAGDEVVVDTADGEVRGDVVVVAIGIVPNQEVAEASGLAVGNGILVDERCRTSVPNVYAVGDVANHYHPLYDTRLRVEHFDSASKQAAVAAQNMVGRDATFSDPHWFWSDQFGHNLQCVGHPDPADEIVFRGQPGSEEFTAFFLRDGSIRAAFAVDRAEDIMLAREHISAGVSVPVANLSDPESDLFEALEMA
jgi:3-phenylpropionate/trans-cinnamate dioxygenase ferredoxin reductase subunit